MLLALKRRYQDLPSGFAVLCFFYLINAALIFVSSLLYFEYLDIIVFGIPLNEIYAFLVKSALIIVPIYLAYGISLLKKRAYLFAISYHLFFIINGILTILYFQKTNQYLKPILEIALKKEYKVPTIRDFFSAPTEMYLLQIGAAIIGLLILTYLLTKRRFFKA